MKSARPILVIAAALGVMLTSLAAQSSTLHVFYQDKSGQLVHTSTTGSTWTRDTTGLFPSSGSTLASFGASGGTLHAFFVNNSHIVEAYKSGISGWTANDLSVAASSTTILADPSFTELSSFLAPGGSEHVFYTAKSPTSGGNIHVFELYWTSSTGWRNSDLTNLGHGAAVQADPLSQPFSGFTSFVDGTGEHVFYISKNDFHIHHLYYGTSWVDQDLTQITATGGGFGLTGFAATGGTEHVYYVSTTDGGVHELYWSSGTGWKDTNLTIASGSTALPTGLSITSFFNSTGEYVYYFSADVCQGCAGKGLYQLKWTSSTNKWVTTRVLQNQITNPQSAMAATGGATGISQRAFFQAQPPPPSDLNQHVLTYPGQVDLSPGGVLGDAQTPFPNSGLTSFIL